MWIATDYWLTHNIYMWLKPLLKDKPQIQTGLFTSIDSVAQFYSTVVTGLREEFPNSIVYLDKAK